MMSHQGAGHRRVWRGRSMSQARMAMAATSSQGENSTLGSRISGLRPRDGTKPLPNRRQDSHGYPSSSPDHASGKQA